MQKAIAISDIDAYQWFRGSYSNETWPDFAARLMRRTKANIAMRIGTDLHETVRMASSGSLTDVVMNGRVDNVGSSVSGFNFVEHAKDTLLPLRDAVFESPVRAPVMKGVDIVGRIDAIAADGDVWEFKTTRNSGSGWAERYLTAWQWRMYLYALYHEYGKPASDMKPLRNRTAHYAVFMLKYDPAKVTEGSVIEVSEVHELELPHYNGLSADVRRAVAEFVSFIDAHLPCYWRRTLGEVKAAPMESILRNPHQWSRDEDTPI